MDEPVRRHHVSRKVLTDRKPSDVRPARSATGHLAKLHCRRNSPPSSRDCTKDADPSAPSVSLVVRDGHSQAVGQVSPWTDCDRARRHLETRVPKDLEQSERQSAACRVACDHNLRRRDRLVLGFRGRVEQVQVRSQTVLKGTWERILRCLPLRDGNRVRDTTAIRTEFERVF